MAANEKFCLRWNDFESNVSTAFRDLREEKDFFDVTLACDDSQVDAHKVILAACSPFFRNVLRRNPHQHPLLYLKGVKYKELVCVLNFMYQGEVNVAQEELNTFLSIAEELQVKGLTQEDKRTGQGEPAKAGAGQISVEGRTGVVPPAKRRRHVVTKQRICVYVVTTTHSVSRALPPQQSLDGRPGVKRHTGDH